MAVRLAIVNDYEIVVRGVADMIESTGADIEIVELTAQLPVSEPVDIALYDTFAQPQGHSPEVRELVGDPLVRRVAVYTWSNDPHVVRTALDSGVSAYLSKTLPADELVAALRKVHEGERVVMTTDASTDADLSGPLPGAWPGQQAGLTAREAEVIALITQGYSNNKIAAKACLSINSVKTYIRTSYRKMGVTSRTNAVLWGIEHGFAPDRVRIRPDSEAS